MLKKFVIGVFLFFACAAASSSFADELKDFQRDPGHSIGYVYYINEGKKAFDAHDRQKAIRYFRIARIFYPGSREAAYYLGILYQTPSEAPLLNMAAPQVESQQPAEVQTEAQPVELQQAQTQPAQAQTQRRASVAVAPMTAGAQPPEAVISPAPLAQPVSAAGGAQSKPALYVEMPNKGPTAVFSLSQLTANGVLKPKIQMVLHSSMIIEGRGIQQFLIIDQGFITAEKSGPDRLRITAQRIGSTFIHVWDASGRNTLYIQVVFPKSVSTTAAMSGIRHAQPFIVTYANDWSTYYEGKNVSSIKRQGNQFLQSLSLTGETPYGFFDAYGSYTYFNGFSEFDTYTVGLSQIPLPGVSNFNVRGFDALRYLSPLTMPATRLRGFFADVDVLHDMVGLSFSEGQEQAPFGFISSGQSLFTNAYIDAFKLTLFPKSRRDQYSVNFATAYGPQRQPYLSNHVYSIEGHHQFNDFLAMDAEHATDTRHDSSWASLDWQKNTFRSNFVFRNIDKNYSTISTLPAYQGETGAAWTTDGDFKRFSESTFLEVYHDALYGNPGNSSALNADGNGHLRVNINQNWWTDSDINFVTTPGEISPRDTYQFNQRLSRSFGVWHSLKGTVFAGAGYEASHSSVSGFSDFNREDLLAGFQLPFTNQVSAFANYEYDWLHQPNGPGNTNPNIINAGIEYQKQFNPKFSITSQAVYRDELGVTPETDLLSGEQSVILSAGFNYNPSPDVSIFADGDVSRVLSHINNPSYDDLEFHIGMRLTFGGTSYWDPLGTVEGVVFKDAEGLGKYVPGDEGIAGVKIKVGDKEVTTDKKGRYRIKIRAKGVQVYPVLDSLPGGFLFSTPQALDVDIIQGHVSKADFGLITQTGIYGIVFVDVKGTHSPTQGDKFIGKVKVVLDGKTVRFSDSHGAFYFHKVTPGEHVISIDINTLAIDLVPMVKLQNKIDVAEGTNYMFNIPLKLKEAQGSEE